MGDFNGRIGSNIYGGDPILNSNGERLLNFRDDACLNIVNCSNKCHGKITWFRHPHSSCIDYFLSSNSIDKCIEKMIVDEDRNFHIGSDHNILMLYLKFKPSKHSYNKPKVMHKTWNISHDQDWSAFQNSIRDQFNNWDVNEFNDPDLLWSSWKNTIVSIANVNIGYKKT
jgi:hypothetical protein